MSFKRSKTFLLYEFFLSDNKLFSPYGSTFFNHAVNLELLLRTFFSYLRYTKLNLVQYKNIFAKFISYFIYILKQIQLWIYIRTKNLVTCRIVRNFTVGWKIKCFWRFLINAANQNYVIYSYLTNIFFWIFRKSRGPSWTLWKLPWGTGTQKM